MKNKLSIIIIAILLIFSLLALANNNNQIKNNTENQDKAYIIDIEKYIYDNLKLSPKEYQFKEISNNENGNIIYTFKIFKAKGTLLININIPYNLIGYRILENVKELSSISIGFDNTILLNTITGENKFYYINSSGTTSFDSPSFNTTKIHSFKNGFYWIGFKYKDKNKKLADKNQYLFIFQNNKITDYSLTKIKNKIKLPFNLIVINPNTAIIEKAYNLVSKDLFMYNLKTEELEKIENQKNIIIGNTYANKLYYLIADQKTYEIEIKSINLTNLNISKEAVIKLPENNNPEIKYFPINLWKTQSYILLNLFSKENKNIKTIIYNKNLEEILNKDYQNKLPILYETQTQTGYYYIYKEYVEIFTLK